MCDILILKGLIIDFFKWSFFFGGGESDSGVMGRDWYYLLVFYSVTYYTHYNLQTDAYEAYNAS